MLALLLVVAGASAQKVDQRLTRLVEKSDARRAQRMTTLNTQAVKQQIAVVFNADGTTRIKKVIDFSKGTKQVYDTDEAIKALTTDDPTDSHGTHTSAIAGGSDLGNG